jgi:phytoene desaturase
MIIIGAGLAGLATGCYGQMNGFRTQIFEHHTQPGGVATWWKRKGYLIDGGIHFLMGHRPGQSFYNLYSELDLHKVRVADMKTYGFFVDEVSGRTLEVTPDLDQLEADLKSISLKDSRVIEYFIQGARALQGSEMWQMELMQPPELQGHFVTIKMLWKLGRASKYFIGKAGKSIAEFVDTAPIHDPLIRKFFLNLFLPEVPVWFGMSLLALLADGELCLPKDGCQDFVHHLVQRYKNLGGDVTYKATVEKILVKNNSAVGVQLANGEEYHADILVSAADGYSTIFKMLDGNYISKQLKEMYNKWGLGKPIILISFGVKREFKEEPSTKLILLKTPFKIGKEAVPGFLIRFFNYGDKFAPAGNTVVQVMLESEWDWWHSLQRDTSLYEAEKERLTTEVLERLESYYPGFSQLVEMSDVATPYTYWRYTLNHRGAYMGWLPTPKALQTTLKRSLPGLSNFYMAGQWIVPGGGVPGCLNSGRHVVQILCQREKRQFRVMEN